MRTIEWTNAFKRDFRKLSTNPRYRDLDVLLGKVGNALAGDEVLAPKYRDGLVGEYTGHGECHLKPDLLLIYKKPDEMTLRFVRIGSHSELF